MRLLPSVHRLLAERSCCSVSRRRPPRKAGLDHRRGHRQGIGAADSGRPAAALPDGAGGHRPSRWPVHLCESGAGELRCPGDRGRLRRRKEAGDGGGAETVTLDFALDVVPFTLEEIITTATGEQRRLELGHTVSSIRADSLTASEADHQHGGPAAGPRGRGHVLPSSGTVGAGPGSGSAAPTACRCPTSRSSGSTASR